MFIARQCRITYHIISAILSRLQLKLFQQRFISWTLTVSLRPGQLFIAISQLQLNTLNFLSLPCYFQTFRDEILNRLNKLPKKAKFEITQKNIL